MYAIVVGFAVAIHLAFIAYVVFGGFVALRWRRTIWLHVPAVIWGIAIATKQVDCPLTFVERWARRHAGMPPLPPDGFIAHYLTGTVYPVDWLVGVQLASFALVAGSWAVYFRREAGRRRRARAVTRRSCDGRS